MNDISSMGSYEYFFESADCQKVDFLGQALGSIYEIERTNGTKLTIKFDILSNVNSF